MDNEYDWFVGVQGRDKSLTAKETITEEARKRVTKIAVFFNELTDASPYKQLDDHYNDFKKYISQLIEQSRTKSPTHTELREIYTKFDSLLSSFRAFDDRTQHNLSVRYGKDSDQFSKFDTALSYEFDNVFEYRLCSQLRNYSQHAGSPITGIQSSAHLENEISVSSLQITIDTRILLAKYDKWQRKVKKDLQSINGVLHLMPILTVLRASCSRAFSKYLISQEEDIRSAITELKDIVGDIKENEFPIILGIRKDAKITKKLENLKIQQTKIELVPLLERILLQAHHIDRQ